MPVNCTMHEFGIWFDMVFRFWRIASTFSMKKTSQDFKLAIFPIKEYHKEQNENWWECREVSVDIILHKRVLESSWMWSIIKIPKSLYGEAKCK